MDNYNWWIMPEAMSCGKVKLVKKYDFADTSLLKLTKITRTNSLDLMSWLFF